MWRGCVSQDSRAGQCVQRMIVATLSHFSYEVVAHGVSQSWGVAACIE
ncbi:MAG: hypothetical protein OJF49_002509 [Ktedonobacterales bacterium]|nr:MAG: hypothetical protein OJF49_002509 [Ktedonobacterales bacterium]